MSDIQVSASAQINAPAAEIYNTLADYHSGHPAILPKETFRKLAIEKGGKGAGTRITFIMMVMGSERTMTMEVSEPEPGRVLAETDTVTGAVTTFTVDTLEGKSSQVTIATESPASPGLAGWFERLMVPSFLKGIYQKELDLLAKHLQNR